MRALLPVALLLSAAILAAGAPVGALLASPTTYAASNGLRTYAVLDATGATVGAQAWRVVNGTGNCCENHVVVGPDGRIYDIGADQPFFSEDGGKTWKRPATLLTLPQGEGAATIAPNGDFVGMSWDPYTGDRVVTYKREAATGLWYASHVALHGPLYDRPWIGVAQGPFDVAGTQYPYAVLMTGGWPEPTTYVSFDGLTYALLSTHQATLRNVPVRAWLDQPAQAWADWSQPTSHARIVPLPAGGALVGGALLCPWALFRTDATTQCFMHPDGLAPSQGILRFDSQGRLHAFEGASSGFYHGVSTDGGRTFARTLHKFPPNLARLSWDAVANGALDAAAVSILFQDNANPSTPVTRTLVYKLENLSTAPTARILQVGTGDRYFGAGVTELGPRFDFITVGMLPDGRVVTSFGDLAHSTPRLAVET